MTIQDLAKGVVVNMSVDRQADAEKLIEGALAKAVAEEREACALIAEGARDDEEYGHAAFRCVQIAQAIRARNTEGSNDLIDAAG